MSDDKQQLIQATARVAAVRDGMLWLEADNTATCGGCSLRRSCPSAVMAGLTGRRGMQLQVPDRVAAAPGDRVVVGIPRTGLLAASMGLYLLPVATLILGAALGDALAGNGTALAGGAIGLAAGVMWSARHLRRYAATAKPRVLALATREEGGDDGPACPPSSNR
jgi:sigma-E factor negative regulatory protein RseC